MTAVNPTELVPILRLEQELQDAVDRTALDVIKRRRTMQPRRRGWLVRRMLLTADVAGLVGAMLVSEWFFTSRENRGSFDSWVEICVFASSLPLWIVIAKLYKLYDRDEERTDHSTADEFAAVFHMVTVCTWLFFAGTAITGMAHPTVGKLVAFWLVGICGVSTCRAVARAIARRSLLYMQNTVIVGAGDVGQTVARKLLKHPEYGLNLVGFIDAEPKAARSGIKHVALLGAADRLRSIIVLLDVERVIFAFSLMSDEEAVHLVRSLDDLDVQIDIVPRLFELVDPGVGIHTVEGLPLLGLPPTRLAVSSRLLKRALDVVGSSVGLLVLLPVFAAIAVAIVVDSRGPVLFRQVRMGRGGRPFRILKFRTMVVDAEARKADVAHLNRHARNGGDARMFKIDADPRITRVGSRLRRFSLDELPQLWNVLRGEMSLVGPRPLILDEHAHVTDWAVRRLDLRPGVTGLWQVHGRDGIPFDEMVRLDYLYVTTWSLGSDIRLVLRTVPLVFRRHGV